MLVGEHQADGSMITPDPTLPCAILAGAAASLTRHAGRRTLPLAAEVLLKEFLKRIPEIKLRPGGRRLLDADRRDIDHRRLTKSATREKDD